MKISKYVNKYYPDFLINNDHKISIITDNSKDVINNAVFVAIKGYKINGSLFISEAIDKGARTIIYRKQDLDGVDFSLFPNINFIKVENPKIELARILKMLYYKKIKSKLIAITGTNGKTTVSTSIYQIIKSLYHSVLLIGTEGNYCYDKNQERFTKTINTTPSILNIYKSMIEFNFEYVVMEVSSQGLDELRVLGLEFDIVAFTNITQDHLDYHKTIDNYASSKSKLVYLLKEDGILILNKDMNYYDKVSNLVINKQFYFSTTNTDASVYGKVCDYYIDMMEIALTYKNKKYDLVTKLLGEFNLENLLLIFLIMVKLNFNEKIVIEALEKIVPVKGRMNLYSKDLAYVIIDFAHTPDGVKQVLEYVNNVKKNKIITVIGCGGNKDKLKRPIMGYIASNNSDVVIFTEDNSRDEETIDIINDMIKKLDKDNYYIECDRKKAIDLALSIKEEDDIILLLGKGSEESIIRHEKIPFSDLKYIESLGGVRLNE